MTDLLRSAVRAVSARVGLLVPRALSVATPPAGMMAIFQHAASGHLYRKNDAGTEVDLEASGSGTPASSVVTETSYGQASAVGSSTNYARQDHTHGSPSLGSTGSTACAGNDARLSDARTPTAHKASHQEGGSDALLDLDESASLGPQSQSTGLFVSPGATTTGWPLAHRVTRRKVRAVQASGAGGVFGIGHQDPTNFSATPVNANDADGSWISYTSTTQMGHSSSAYTLVRQAHLPLCEWLLKTGSDVTNIRIHIGLFSAAASNADDPGGHCASFRYSSIGGDAGWIALTRDGTTLSASSSLGAVAASTVYRLTLWWDGTGYRFAVNGGASTQRTSNLPGSTTDLGYNFKMFVTGGANRTINFGATSLESA